MVSFSSGERLKVGDEDCRGRMVAAKAEAGRSSQMRCIV